MMRAFVAVLCLSLAGSAAAQSTDARPSSAPARLELTRLDCGTIGVGDFDTFSDTYLYEGQPKQLTSSCYLVRHGDSLLLWDTGLSGDYVKAQKAGGYTMALKGRITDQLARLSLRPSDIDYVGISHYHDDHTGQAADFPGATLLVGTGDWDVIKGRPQTAPRFKPWLGAGAKVEVVARDKDVFGDKSVVVLDMPGHTPGHKALLVRLRSGPVLLTGDLYHATEQVANRGVPGFNTNRADTLASFDRFQAIARSLNAKVIIQHEPADVPKLPAFPQAAR
jgi:glyoxylase-like metal-dependent hydrolase (beta-lactamase superfamily II)